MQGWDAQTGNDSPSGKGVLGSLKQVTCLLIRSRKVACSAQASEFPIKVGRYDLEDA